MCEHCVDGKLPVRTLHTDGSEGQLVGEVIGLAIVDNVGTVYLHINGHEYAATIPDWYGPVAEPTLPPPN